MRKIININSGWDFTKENRTDTVNLPHTWNAVDGQSDKNYYRGKCSYRKTIQRYDGNVVLEINGANTRSCVFVNGNFVGEHINGHLLYLAGQRLRPEYQRTGIQHLHDQWGAVHLLLSGGHNYRDTLIRVSFPNSGA